jgi:hypothetical protein
MSDLATIIKTLHNDKDLDLIIKCAADPDGLILTATHTDAVEIMRKAKDNGYSVLSYDFAEFAKNPHAKNINIYISDVDKIIYKMLHVEELGHNIKIMTMNADHIKLTNTGLVINTASLHISYLVLPAGSCLFFQSLISVGG